VEEALIEPGKTEVWAVGDVFKDLRKGASADAGEEGLKAGADESEGAGGVGVAEEAGIFAPLGIAHPVAAFATPVGTDDGRQAGPIGLGVVQTADKVAGDVRALLGGQRVVGVAGDNRLSLGGLELGALGLGGLGLGGIGEGAGFDQAVGLGKVTGRSVGRNRAQFAQFLSPVAAVGGRKRGGASANCPCA
jgi:hypothetical protein